MYQYQNWMPFWILNTMLFLYGKGVSFSGFRGGFNNLEKQARVNTIPKKFQWKYSSIGTKSR